MRSVFALLLVAFIATGCSSSGGSDSTLATVPPTDAPTTTTLPQPIGPPYFEGLVLPAISLLTPTSGVGERPLLEWGDVDGVAEYHLFIFSESGRLYWSWATSEPSAWVGGIESTEASLRAPGPRLQPGMTWAVLGLDEASMLIAQSERRPISP